MLYRNMFRLTRLILRLSVQSNCAHWDPNVNAKHTKLYTDLNVRNMMLDILRKLKNTTLCGSEAFKFEFKFPKGGKA